jgi:hypothetical protein
MMPSEPLKRIYFDTNWLRRWPNPANNVPAVRRAANWMDTEIYIPETVEDELENQFLRDTVAAYINASSAVEDLSKLFRNVIDIQYELPRPSDELLRKAFRVRSAQSKEYFQNFIRSSGRNPNKEARHNGHPASDTIRNSRRSTKTATS